MSSSLHLPLRLRVSAVNLDVQPGLNMLVTIKPQPGAYYNIGGSFSCTVRKMLDHLLSLSSAKGIEVKVDRARLRPIDADLQVPDTRKFQQHTGWKPEIPFEKTMQDLLDYWRGRIAAGGKFLIPLPTLELV